VAEARFSLIFGQTLQEVGWYPPDARDGVPSAVEAKVWRGGRGDDQDAEFTASVSVDAVLTTPVVLSAASGYSQTNRRRLNMVSTTLTVGRFYRLYDSATAFVEIVKVVAKGTGYADVEFDLAYDYTTAATVTGLYHYFTPDPTFLATESLINDEDSPYRVRWTYTAAGTKRRALQLFDLVRTPPAATPTDDQAIDGWPAVVHMVPEQTRRRLMAEARRMVEKDLRNRKLDPVMMTQDPTWEQVVKAAFCVVTVRSGAACPAGFQPADALRQFQRQYLDDLEMAISAGALKQGENRGEGNANPDPLVPFGFRS